MHGRQDSAAKAFNILREEMNDEVSAVFLGRIDFFKAEDSKSWLGHGGLYSQLGE
jgi:hypothetical protein